jgi:hypothetical protein
MRMLGAARITLLVIAFVLTGCAGSGPGGGGGTKKPSCKPQVDPAAAPKYAANIQPIYNVSCALAGCHLGPLPAQFLDLSAGKSYHNTVGVRSTEQRDLQLVKPNDPENSYLFKKIRGDPGVTIMPQGCPGAPLRGALCLTADQIDAVRTWILACAPNN